MLFWLKKMLTVPLLPLYFSMLCGVAGCICLFRPRSQRIGRFLASLAMVTLLIFSNKEIALLLVRPLENQFAAVPEIENSSEVPVPLAACRAIVVLGGGHADSPGLSRINQLSTSSLSRVAEAVRLIRWLPQAKFVTSGHHLPELSHARVLAEAAISLGVNPARIEQMDEPRDTDDEIAELSRRFGTTPIAIVTSAWHMQRTVELCRSRNVTVIPCPADFLSKPESDGETRFFTWDLESLERSTRAVHEYVGILWLKIRLK